MIEQSADQDFRATVLRMQGLADTLASATNEIPDGAAERHVHRIVTATLALREAVANNAVPLAQSSTLRHELRNRLNHISGPCQLLRRAANAASLHALIEDIQAALERCVAIVDDSGETSRARAAPPRLQQTTTERPAPAHILVAEDDPGNRQLLVEVLSADGHRVTTACDGVEALRLAEEGDFDLLLLDLGLPKINGFEVLEKLQAGGWRTPVIVVTGRRAVDDAVRCIEHGADDFLTKPIHIEVLRARVHSSVEKIRLREREFGQFFPLKLARQFARRPQLIEDLPSRHAEISIMFCDIRNFTAISERLGPETTTRWLRGVMNELAEIISMQGGVLVDFAGDEIMAMWGAPEETADHARLACDTAVQILERLPAMNDRWQDEIGHETDLAIGINSGRAMVGHVGTTRKIKYGALGDAVNIGSRVLGATKYVRARLLITGATQRALGSTWTRGRLRRLIQVRVKNLTQAIELYEVQPHGGDTDGKLRDRYEAGLVHFENGRFHEASAILGQLLVDYPSDGPSLMLMSRVVSAMLAESNDFDPVWTLDGK